MGRADGIQDRRASLAICAAAETARTAAHAMLRGSTSDDVFWGESRRPIVLQGVSGRHARGMFAHVLGIPAICMHSGAGKRGARGRYHGAAGARPPRNIPGQPKERRGRKNKNENKDEPDVHNTRARGP